MKKLGLWLIGSILMVGVGSIEYAQAETTYCTGATFSPVTGKLSRFRVEGNNIMVTVTGNANEYIMSNDASVLSTLLMATDNPSLTITINKYATSSCSLQLNVQ